MDNNLKNEFKEFIDELSTSICKEVLLEELKDINNSFNATSNEYKQLSNSYVNNINGIKEQLNKLQNTNMKLDKFVDSVNANNDKVNKSLELIDGSHKKVIDNIMVDNKKLFLEYSKVVQSLNENEREKFISELLLSMEKQNKNHIEEMKDVVDGGEIKNILKDIRSISSKISSVDYQFKEMDKKLGNIEKKIIEGVNTKVKSLENQVNNTTNALNNSMQNIDKKNKIIVGLLVICIMLIFFK